MCTCVSGFCGCFWCNVFFVGVSCPGNSTSDSRGVAFSVVGGAMTANCSSGRTEFAQYTKKFLDVFQVLLTLHNLCDKIQRSV